MVLKPVAPFAFWLDNGSGGAGSIPAKTTGRVNVTALKPPFLDFGGAGF